MIIKKGTKLKATLENKIGIKEINWSESFVDMLVCGNYDGSINFWNVNKKKQKSMVDIEEGYEINSVSWNSLNQKKILVGSSSSRIFLLDLESKIYNKI
jgi:WD40 repeat protein